MIRQQLNFNRAGNPLTSAFSAKKLFVHGNWTNLLREALGGLGLARVCILFQGLRSGVWGLVFGVKCLGFGGYGLGLRVKG